MIYVFGLLLLLVLAIALIAVPFWRRARRTEAVLGSVLVAGIAIGMYLLVGRPDLGLAPPVPPSEELLPENIEALVAQLAERLGNNPDDPQGWTMLGRSYVLLGRYEEAARAFAQAQARTTGENADLLASFAEARTLADPAGLEGELGALFERVLELDPRNARGLWYGGLAAQARGEAQTAAQRWRALLEEEDLPQEFRRVVEAQIASLDVAATGALLEVEVEIAGELSDRIPPNAVLYLFMRTADDPGQGPPLLARRISAPTLPLHVTLTRDDLLRGGELPDATFNVVARLSADGDPTAGPGDIEGAVRWHPDDGDALVRILLDRPISGPASE